MDQNNKDIEIDVNYTPDRGNVHHPIKVFTKSKLKMYRKSTGKCIAARRLK